MRDFIKETLSFFLMFILCFCFLLIFFYISLFLITYFQGIHLFPWLLKDTDLVVHASSVILTMALIIVASLQLRNLNRTSTADFLLRIDSRYGNKQIIAARAIIQRLYRNANPSDKRVSEERYIEKIADGIDKIRKSTSKRSCEEFSYLLNLLDFLETISYFSRKKYISVNDVDDLIGNSVIFYYKVYKRWIYYRRHTYSNPSYYCEFEGLVEKLKSQQLKQQLAKTCFIIRFINYFH